MGEVKEQNKQLGVFNASNLLELETRNEIFEFVDQNRFFVLMINDFKEIKDHPIIRKMQEKGGFCTYRGIVITINGMGMEMFKDTFHRSSSYVDQKMIPYKDFKKIFEQLEQKEEIINFFADIVKNFGEFQVKGMKKIFLREKVIV